MIQALYQTISNFFVEIPAISNLFNNVKTGDIDLLGGLVSMLKGIFRKNED